MKSSFTLEWRPLCIFFLSLTLGVFFLFLRQRDKIPYLINTNIRDCWPVFQVANKEKTLGPRLLALHFPVVLWYKWSRQAHHLSLTNLLPAKTVKVKWLGFCGSKKWNSKLPFPRNQEWSRAKAKTRNFPSLIFLRGRGGGQSSAEYKGIANSYPPKIKDEAAQRPKRTIFPWGEMGLNFPSILSKIVVYGRSAWDTLGQGVKSTKNWTFHFLARPHASIALLTLGWGETETAATQSKRINASLNFYQQNFQLKLPRGYRNICHNRLYRTTTWLVLFTYSGEKLSLQPGVGL